MVNGGCVCVSSTYVVRLCVGNDAICLILAVGWVTLAFAKAVKKQGWSVIRVKIVLFVLMRIKVFGVCVSLLLRIYWEWTCRDILSKRLRKFHCRRQRESAWMCFISDGIMFEDFLNGGWLCRYRVENLFVTKMFKVFSCRSSFLFC